jgi:hypothetical protein
VENQLIHGCFLLQRRKCVLTCWPRAIARHSGCGTPIWFPRAARATLATRTAGAEQNSSRNNVATSTALDRSPRTHRTDRCRPPHLILQYSARMNCKRTCLAKLCARRSANRQRSRSKLRTLRLQTPKSSTKNITLNSLTKRSITERQTTPYKS